jgi:hypothetical protein
MVGAFAGDKMNTVSVSKVQVLLSNEASTVPSLINIMITVCCCDLWQWCRVMEGLLRRKSAPVEQAADEK